MKLHERIPLLINMARTRHLTGAALNRQTKKEANVIVSFTSIPSRLAVVHHTVKSVLIQSRPPKKLILWLHNSIEKKDIPASLTTLCGERFEIRFTPIENSPHMKLVPSLLAFPLDTIVTCDDDLYYSRHWLKNLVHCAEQNPNTIIAQRFRKIQLDGQGKPLRYRQWCYDHKVLKATDQHLALGFGGILYPPNALHEDAVNSDIYMNCCPKADDLWFKAMSYLNGSKYVAPRSKKPHYILMDSQEVCLKSGNIDGDKNLQQWQQICRYYPALNHLCSN